MNYSTIVLSIADNVKTVGVKFYKEGSFNAAGEQPDKYTLGPKEYVYKTTLDLYPGDHVVVSVSGMFKVVVVTSLNPQASGDKTFNWVVQKLDTASYWENQQTENMLIARVQTLEAENRRRQFLDLLGGGDELKQLTFK